MSGRLEVVEIATGLVVYSVSCGPANHDRALRGLLGNIGRFDSRLCRPDDDEEVEDERLDTDRYFARFNPSAEGAAVAEPTPQTPPPGSNHSGTTAGEDLSAALPAEGLKR